MRLRSFTCRCRDDVLRAFSEVRGYNFEKTVRITIEEWQPGPKEEQRNLHWRWMEIAAVHSGDTKDDMHRLMKEQFCPAKRTSINGTTQWVKSTKKLSRREMSEFMDREYAFLAIEWGLVLPLPQPQGEMADAGV